LWAGLPIALGAYHQQAIHQGLAALTGHGAWTAILAVGVVLALIARMRIQRDAG
jgi:hypothetical protein